MNSEIYQDYSHGISAIDTAPARPRTDAGYLLVRDGRVALIDTGSNLALPSFLQALEAKRIDRSQVDYLILTHVHLDHAAGAGALMQELPNARLVVHPRGSGHMINPEPLVAAARMVYGEAGFKALFGDMVPVAEERVHQARDGEVITLGASPLELIHTAGHAQHHICIVDHDSRSIFAGDTFGVSYRELDSARGAFIFPATTPIHFNPEAAHASVERLLDYAPEAIFLTHYSRVTDVGRLAADMHQRLDDFVQIALACREHVGDRLRAITEGLREYLSDRLDAHGCSLPRARRDALLQQDCHHNAQGLEYWLAGRA